MADVLVSVGERVTIPHPGGDVVIEVKASRVWDVTLGITSPDDVVVDVDTPVYVPVKRSNDDAQFDAKAGPANLD